MWGHGHILTKCAFIYKVMKMFYHCGSFPGKKATTKASVADTSLLYNTKSAVHLQKKKTMRDDTSVEKKCTVCWGIRGRKKGHAAQVAVWFDTGGKKGCRGVETGSRGPHPGSPLGFKKYCYGQFVKQCKDTLKGINHPKLKSHPSKVPCCHTCENMNTASGEDSTVDFFG